MMKPVKDWNDYFLGIAKEVSTKSNDPETKVGALIVGPDNEIRGSGYNGFPRKVKNTEIRWQRPTKYTFVCHAEANAISNAARFGISLKGCFMYLYGFEFPCHECAKLIIQSGISAVYSLPTETREDWKESVTNSCLMLQEAGVSMVVLPHG